MKKNFHYLSLMFGLFLGMMAFTACGDDEEENSPNQNNGTEKAEAAKDDFGTDGLKGYWVQNTWKEVTINFWGDPNGNSIMGYWNHIIYLDGDGGGTLYVDVTTLDKVNNDKKFLASKIGTFQDTEDGKTKEYFFPQLYITANNKVTKYENHEASYPIEYYIKGTTMTIYYANVTKSMQLNVSSGKVNDHHRLKKVD